MLSIFSKTQMPSTDEALAGREVAMEITDRHFVNGNPLKAPFPEGMQQVIRNLVGNLTRLRPA